MLSFAEGNESQELPGYERVKSQNAFGQWLDVKGHRLWPAFSYTAAWVLHVYIQADKNKFVIDLSTCNALVSSDRQAG